MPVPPWALVHETEHWLVSQRLDSALPGYLMLGAKVPGEQFADLPDTALAALGPLLARVQSALLATLGAERVHVGRYGHAAGWPFHIHLIPIHGWIERLFRQDERYRGLESLTSAPGPWTPDGADLVLFIWREFCERPVPPPIEGPDMAHAIALLRSAL